MKKLLWTAGVAAALASLPLPAQAAPITFAGSSGNLAASVQFDLSGGILTVVLTNTSLNDVLDDKALLTGVFFSFSDSTLTRESALLTAGSTVVYDPDGQPAGGNVGGEWAYTSQATGLPYEATHVISSAGLGVTNINEANLFPGTNLAGPAAPDGAQYGLLSAGDDITTHNGSIYPNNPASARGMIKNSVTFTFSGATCNSVLAACVGNVTFQYGTTLSDPDLHFSGSAVPEPGTLLLLGAGLTGLAAFRRRRI